MKRDNSAIHIKGVPRNVRFNFKISCWQNKTNMREVLIATMRYLQDPERLRNFLKTEEQEIS